jgi:hypothetical protein
VPKNIQNNNPTLARIKIRAKILSTFNWVESKIFMVMPINRVLTAKIVQVKTPSFLLRKIIYKISNKAVCGF